MNFLGIPFLLQIRGWQIVRQPTLQKDYKVNLGGGKVVVVKGL
jgi:hypothetical protein